MYGPTVHPVYNKGLIYDISHADWMNLQTFFMNHAYQHLTIIYFIISNKLVTRSKGQYFFQGTFCDHVNINVCSEELAAETYFVFGTVFSATINS